jgi:hypothetical protein
MDESFIILDHEIASTQSRIADLQKQLAQAETHMRALQTQRNALTLLCRLPEDVLIHVLVLLIRSGHADVPEVMSKARPLSTESATSEQTRSWTQVMGVCTHLRAVTVSCPLLWSYIDLDQNHPAWMQTRLERARRSPLVVNARSNLNAWLGSPLELLGTILSRANNVCFFLQDAQPVEAVVLNAVLNAPAPHLCGLVLAHPTGIVFQLSPQFLGGTTVKLTRLVLQGVMLSRDLPFLPALIHLDVHLLILQGELKRLLLLLERAPELVTLHIGTLHQAFDYGGMRPIALPKLSTLTIATHHRALVALLPILPTPHNWEVLPSSWEGRPPDPGLRADTFVTTFQRFLAVKSGTFSPPQLLWEVKGQHYSLIMTCLKLRIRYKDTSTNVRDFDRILKHMRVLHVGGSALQALFEPAAVSNLMQLERLQVFGNCGDVSAMVAWLRARAGIGQRVMLIHFDRCARTVYFERFCNITEFAHQLAKEGLTDAVFVDGHQIGM